MKKFIVKEAFSLSDTLFIKGDIVYAEYKNHDWGGMLWVVYHPDTRKKAGTMTDAGKSRFLQEKND